MPVSLVSSLKGFLKQEKYSETMHLMMLKGTLDTAVGIDWERPWKELGKWRIIVRWLLWLSSWLSCGGAAANSTYTRKTLTKQNQ
jgi:hypothetical protein